MNRLRSLLLLATLAVAAVASAADAALDFSATSNPNGVWSYGSQTTPGGALSLLTLQDAGPAYSAYGNQNTLRGWNGSSNEVQNLNYPFVLKNFSSTPWTQSNNAGANSGITVPANGLILHASRTAFATLRFTAATAGAYSVSGNFFREQFSGNAYSQRVRVTVGGLSPYDVQLTGNGASSAFNLSSIALAAGGTVDFSVASEGPNDTTSNPAFFDGGSMGLNASVNPVPEPTTLAALGLGALGLLRRRRRAAK